MNNPLLTLSNREFGLINFSELQDEHYAEAFNSATAAHNAEIAAILDTPEITFENTLVAMERSGWLLTQLVNVFFNKTSSDTNETLQQVEAELSPKLTAHLDAISLNPELFARLIELERQRDAGELELDQESDWLLTKYLQDFRHAGAELTDQARQRVAEINEQIAALSAEFDKRLLADSNDLALHFDSAERLGGLSAAELQSLKQAAQDRGKEGFTIPLLNYSGHPLLARLEDRALRKEILQRTLSRGSRENSNDTSELVRKMLKLRDEKARLFGFDDYPSYATSIQTAGSPERIHAVLGEIAPVARRNAQLEAEHLEALLHLEHPGAQLEAWDWDRYAEQLRAQDFDVDTGALKPYFELKRVLEEGVFFAANRLYGLVFTRREDIVGYHSDNWIYQVDFEDGELCGLYIFDPYARPSKSGGAWMNNLVDQSNLLGQKPVVVNNMNIPKPALGEPALMTFDEVNTLFHEFGHTLHGLLSNVTYPRFSGTSVERDFVEFPSQVNEMWMLWPEVLANYAVHYLTGEKLDPIWIDRILATQSFNQGFETTHYLQAAVLDLALHQTDGQISDLAEFEAEAIAAYGLDFHPVPTRYRPNFFAHIFAGGYSAGYYGYIWSEVLDAESVNWFKENGGMTRENGARFASALLSRGGSSDSMGLVRDFLGREPQITPLLIRRGLA